MMVIMIVITEISDDWITCLMVLTFDSFLKRVVKVLGFDCSPSGCNDVLT